MELQDHNKLLVNEGKKVILNHGSSTRMYKLRRWKNQATSPSKIDYSIQLGPSFDRFSRLNLDNYHPNSRVIN